jgi:hypothetical protein
VQITLKSLVLGLMILDVKIVLSVSSSRTYTLRTKMFSQTLPLYILIPSCKTKQNAFFSNHYPKLRPKQTSNYNQFDTHLSPSKAARGIWTHQYLFLYTFEIECG